MENTFGDEMDDLLSRSEVVLNIHFYEDSDLEQVRLAQCSVAGTPLVSEKPKHRERGPIQILSVLSKSVIGPLWDHEL